MLYYIKGKIVEKTPTRVVVEKDGTGYIIDVSLQTSENLGEIGDEAKLYTVLKISDEDVNLYGFSSFQEREFFLLLIGVPGIGPRVALRIFSCPTNSSRLEGLNFCSYFLSSLPAIGEVISFSILYFL